MKLKPHSPEWYDRLAEMQPGYYYPWKSTLPPFNGEDVYLDLVRQHLTPESDVLDVACGHGEVAIQFAPACRSILAYDRIASYIRIAQESARQKGVQNVTFLCADSSAAANDGQPHIPAIPGSFDLVISRRGPLHWIEDARRVARPGAVLIQLNPLDLPPPSWNDQLPKPLQFPQLERHTGYSSVEWRLEEVSLDFHSYWNFVVPEYFPDPEQFFIFRAWGEDPEDVPTFPEVQPDLERIFAHHAGPAGLPILRGRFLWKSVVP